MPAFPGTRPAAHGRMARWLHWLMAAGILAAIALGLVMVRLPAATEADIATLVTAFSAHKTLGIVLLGLAVLRAGWSVTHPAPPPLHPERRLETFLAETVHWCLRTALFVLPLSGWLYHAATPGFAPILWPFGQTLPLVPADERLSLIFRSVHAAAGWLLLGAIALHVLGALRHALLDRDGTLARMTTGRPPPAAATVPTTAAPGRLPALLAALLWAALTGYAALTAPAPVADPFAGFDDPAGDLEPLPPAD